MVKRTRFATCVAIPLALGVLVAQAQPKPWPATHDRCSIGDIFPGHADHGCDRGPVHRFRAIRVRQLCKLVSDSLGPLRATEPAKSCMPGANSPYRGFSKMLGRDPTDSLQTSEKPDSSTKRALNTHQIDAVGISALAPELRRIAALDNKAGLTDVLAHLQLIGVPAFFSFGEQQAFTNSQQQIAYLDQGGIGLPERDYYIQTNPEADQTRQLYVQHVARILELLGEPATAAKDDAGQI